ncbi:hypothetical protein V8C86DRAFT_2725366 [Haematococcus lacustris]
MRISVIARQTAVSCRASTLPARSSLATCSSRRVLLALSSALLGSAAAQPASHARPPAPVAVERGEAGERDVVTVSSGLKYSDVSKGSGPLTKTGDLVLVDVIGRLENGKVFLDTRSAGAPLAFTIGTTNKYVPEGLTQVVEGMEGGSIRLAVLPPSLGYGDQSMELPGGVRIPARSTLYYEVELLRCQGISLGLACCTEATFTGNAGSCIQEPPTPETVAQGT